MEDLLSRLLASLGAGNMLWIGVALLAAFMLLKDSFPSIANTIKSLRDRFFKFTPTDPVDGSSDQIDEIPIRVQVLEHLDVAFTYFERLDCTEGKRAIRLAMAHVYADEHNHPPPAPIGPQPPPNMPPSAAFQRAYMPSPFVAATQPAAAPLRHPGTCNE